MAIQPTASPFAGNLQVPKKPIKPIQQQPEIKPINQPAQGQQITPAPPASGVSGLISPSSKPFNIADTELFRQSQATATSQLRGETPGFDAGATETRESLKLAQAAREKQIREQLAQRGLSGTGDGRFLQEGIIKPEQEQFRERKELERRLLSDKAAQQQSTIAQGQQASAGLLGLLSGEQQAKEQQRLAQEQLTQTGELTREQIASQERNIQSQLQAESERLGRQLTAQEEAQIRDIESKKFLQTQEIGSREFIAKLGIEAQENITLLQDQLNTNQWIRQSDFEGVQAALDRELALARDQGQFDNAREIERMKADLQERMQQRQIASAENLANMDIEAQTELVKLQDRLNTDQFMREIDFQESRDQLARSHELALQNNDFTQATKIEEMQQKLELTMQQKEQEYNVIQNSAMRAWQSGERVAQNVHDKNMAFIDQKFQEAVQNRDILAQERLQDQRLKTELKMQYQDFDHDTKMARLDSDLAEARANNDVGRQKALISFQAQKEFEKIEQEQGFEQAMIEYNGRLQAALQQNDINAVKALEQQKFRNLQQRAADEFQEQQTLLKLDQAFQQQGIDLNQFQSTYDRLAAQEVQGLVDPGSAIKYLKDQLPPDVADSIKIANPNRVFEQIEEDFLQQQFQWAQTHPESGEFDADGNFVGLKDESLEQFNNHLNDTIYQSSEGPIGEKIAKIKAGDIPYEQIGQPGDPVYEKLKIDPSTARIGSGEDDLTFIERYKGDGGRARSIWEELEFNDLVVTDQGELLYVDRRVRESQAGDDNTIYTLINPSTGETYQVHANDRFQ
jgi:hypothetical protein